MDIFLPIVICVIVFILFSICGWCCKRNRQGAVYGGPVATVTSTTYGVSNPPYPVDAPMQQPTPGFNIGGPNPPYPTHPAQPMPGVYPPAPVPPMGYPPMQPMGMFLSMGCSGIIFAFE